MTADPCAEMHLLLQADLDGELAPAESARIAAHLDQCADCAALQRARIALSVDLRREATYHRAPEALRQRIAALSPAADPPTVTPRRPIRLRRAVPFGAGFAVAAALLLAMVPRNSDRRLDEITSDHVRALQPGHLLDVVSTDRHTVKPWFNGKLDFSPAVIDLAEKGFPLAGGRLDAIAGEPVAVLVYKRREHVIDVYVWPAARGGEATPTARNGFNVVPFRAGDLVYWAVSDLDPRELAEFVRLLQTSV